MNPRCSLPEKNPAGFSLRIVRDPEQAKGELQRLVQRTAHAQQREAQGRVDTILTEVRTRGDAAVIEFTERFDGFRPEPVAVPQEQLERSWQNLPTNLQDACLLYTSPSPRDQRGSRMPSSA